MSETGEDPGNSAGWLRVRHTKLESHGKVTGDVWTWSLERDGKSQGPGRRQRGWLGSGD